MTPIDLASLRQAYATWGALVILVKGQVAWTGAPDALRADPDLMNRHLGVDV